MSDEDFMANLNGFMAGLEAKAREERRRSLRLMLQEAIAAGDEEGAAKLQLALLADLRNGRKPPGS